MFSEENTRHLIEKTHELLKIASNSVQDKSEAQKRVEELHKVIPFHDYRYYVLAEPVITDPEYDALFKFLKELENQFPKLKSDLSPTSRVPQGLTKEFPPVDHLVPMLSLDNSYNREDVAEFDRRVKKLTGETAINYTVEPKFDGSGISLIYENDVLVRGATRGDGITGDDITPNIKTLRSIPLKASLSEFGIYKMELRGEVLMSLENFRTLNKKRTQEGQSPFANPRNATAGTLRLQDAKEVAKRNLVAFCYQISYAIDKDGNDLLKSTFLDYSKNIFNLKKLGFMTPFKEMKTCREIDEVMAYCREWEEKRDDYEYEVDGMVIKVNDLSLYEKLGATSHHPRWAMAYKFKARQATSTLEKVEFQVGRVGTITPVAKITPVNIGGANVSSVSMFNEDFVKEKDIRIGDKVLVERAGDVIPYIVKPITEARKGNESPVAFPAHCPSCNSELIRPADESLWRCTNILCPAQALHKLIHFVSKNAMDIDGLGESNIRRFYNLGLIRYIPDIYNLDYDKIEELEGFGKKSAENLKKAIEASKNRPLHRLLFGLGIRFVGETMAKILAGKIECLEELEKWNVEDVISIHDAGARVAESVTVFFRNEENQAMIRELKKHGVKTCQEPVEAENSGGKFEGKTFLFTGSLEKFTRKEAQEKVEQEGGKVLSSVSKNLNYLIAGNEAGSKLKKARETGEVKILSEVEFIDLLNN